MTDPIVAFFDIGLVFSIPLGLAIWQLVVLKRSMRRDREEAERASTCDPPPSAGKGACEAGGRGDRDPSG
ncbi:MAG: hypothetical protein K2Y56_09615 [Methylobacterium sp.]|uniref:hypothetical protein n=1 Tax=Methylobacterium sp. TaxID=409 RepID=UPI0025DF4F57|nr:hypothetical protein [Methylobacterium sp.]MBX9931777.1 hypothetical protein [Methylobacterium sp.]